MSDLQYPPYPCVAVAGQTKMTRYNDSGQKYTEEGEEIMYVPITSSEDLFHIDHLRQNKYWAVIGYANLEKILENAPYKRGEVAKIKKVLDVAVRPPEMARVSRMTEKPAATAVEKEAMAKRNARPEKEPGVL